MDLKPPQNFGIRRGYGFSRRYRLCSPDGRSDRQCPAFFPWFRMPRCNIRGLLRYTNNSGERIFSQRPLPSVSPSSRAGAIVVLCGRLIISRRVSDFNRASRGATPASRLAHTWPADSARFSWQSANLTSFPNLSHALSATASTE
jgi:hypothetical protein